MASTFSYAEAAKGRTPSMTASSAPKSLLDESEQQPPNSSSFPSAGQASVPNGVGDDRGVAEGPRHVHEEATKPTKVQIVDSENDGGKEEQTTPNPKSGIGATSSPQLSSNTASLSLKNDDTSATPAESTESQTWEKASQESQADEKMSRKVEEDGDDNKLSIWEHLPTAPQLKEAPPPAVNIWAQRAMDAQAKGSTARGPDNVITNGNVVPSGNTGLPPTNGKRKPRASISDNSAKRGAAETGITNRSRSTDDSKKTARTAFNTSSDSRHAVNPGRRPREQKASAKTPLPPSSDAVSWPTPDLAKEEERKRSQEKVEKSEKSEKEDTPGKTRGKEKWVSVPHVPTVVFNTPLPTSRRGGKPAPRGGRESSGRGGAFSTSRNTERGNETVNVGAPTTERTRAEGSQPRRGGSMPRSRRAFSASHTAVQREERTVVEAQEATQDTRALPSGTSNGTQDASSHREPASRKLRAGTGVDAQSETSHPANALAASNDTPPRSRSQENSAPRLPNERKSEPFLRGYDGSREHNNHVHRESRPERGRGGYRGRNGYAGPGGYHNAHNQGFGNGPNNHSFVPHYGAPKAHAFPEGRNGSHPGLYSSNYEGREGRYHRTNSRSQSISNQQTFNRYGANSGPGQSYQLPQIQTDVSNMYAMQAPYRPPGDASFYHPYMEHPDVLGIVRAQMDYYFSLDNLVKDMFLRKNMNSHGFVPLALLMGFNRVKALKVDHNMVRFACQQSPEVDLQMDKNGKEHVRKAQDWKEWILPVDQRVSDAQSDGPDLHQVPPFSPPPQTRHDYGFSPPASYLPPPYPQNMMPNGSPIAPADGERLSKREPTMNGHVNGTSTHDTPLSAAVPEFTPAFSMMSQPMQNVPPGFNPADQFPDQNINHLTIVTGKHANNDHAQPKTLSMPPNPRTFSNGTIDPKTISEDLSNSDKPLVVNGDHNSEHLGSEGCLGFNSPSSHSTSPVSQTRQRQHDAPAQVTVLWVKDKNAPTKNLPADLTHVPYLIYRSRALQGREGASAGQCHRDMDILFQFWSHFLLRNFNTSMYVEFRSLALDDAERKDSAVGMKNLITFYDRTMLNEDRVISDRLARDFVELVKSEAGAAETPAYEKLRAIWRNGAFPLKNRIKMEKIVDRGLKAELES